MESATALIKKPMKKTNTLRKNFILSMSLLMLGGTANAALVAHGVGAAGGATEPGDYLTLTGIAGDGGDGVTFTYDIILTGALVRTTANGFNDASLGNDYTTTDSFENGDAFTVEIDITSVTGGTVDFDGFSGFTAGAASGADGFLINGVNYRVSGGDEAISNNGYEAFSSNLFAGPDGGTFAATALAQTSTDNGVVLTGLSWEFTTTVIPEPSSTALLGLGGLALILRRRR